VQELEDGACGLLSLSEKTRECRCLYKGTVIFPQLFFLKDPECGSSWGLIQQPPVQQTSPYPIEIIVCEQDLLGVWDIELSTVQIRVS